MQMERFRRFQIHTNRFFLGIPFLFALLAVTALVPIFEIELQATIAYIFLISIILLVCGDIMAVFFPALLLCAFVTRCYDCYDRFIPYKWWLIPAFAAMILHFCLYRRKIRLGETFWGLCAVSVAVTVSSLHSLRSGEGWGEITWIALYYLFGLGFGLLGAYLLLRSQLKVERPYDPKQKFALIMTFAGIFVCVCIAVFYIKGLAGGKGKEYYYSFQPSNNLATLLLMAMPFPAWLSLKKKGWLPLLFLFFAGTVLSTSRGGALMGGAELLLCLVCLSVFDRKFRFLYPILAATFALVGFFTLPYVAYYLWNYTKISVDGSFFDCLRTICENYGLEKEGRFGLISRMKTDFLSDPIFGRGIFYRGNEDLYHPRTGAMNWYHIWFAQIIGSMGIIGILAYGYQLGERIFVTVRNRSEGNWFFFLSYVGLFLMSQVNPGEFCPLPYAIHAVILFILIEERTLFSKRKKTLVNQSIIIQEENLK